MRFAPALIAVTVFSSPVFAATPGTQPSAGAATGKAQLAANEQLPRKGKVVSSMDASIYTYIEVNENGKNVWIAAPTVAVKKGDTVRFSDGAVMSNFHSKSLNRTFDSIIFVGKAAVDK
jgi:hypothetical protein